MREDGLLGSRKDASQWIHFLIDTNTPDWSDPGQRMKKASEILGVSFADITAEITPDESQE